MEFNFDKDYVLEDDFVKLSPLKIEHVKDLLEISDEADIWTYSFVKGNGKENLQNYIQATLSGRKAGKEYPFVVFDKLQNQYAGCTRFYDIIPSLQSLRIGYTWYGKKFRGTGLNKHCKYLLFDFAFEQMNMERIGLGAYAENELSIHAMKSVGCVQEGFFRGLLPHPKGKGRMDAILFSILKDEWESEKKELLKGKLR